MRAFQLRNLKGAMILLFSILVFSCTSDPIPGEVLHGVGHTVKEEANRIIKDQYIVVISKRPVKKDKRAGAALEALSKEVGQMNGARVRGIFQNTITGFAAKMTARQAERLRNDPRVISVTPDKFLSIDDEVLNDVVTVQDYPSWGLDRIDQRESYMDRAYVHNSSGTGVNIYIMDSGINYTHEDFNNRATLGKDFVRDYPDEEYDEDDPEIGAGDDCNGHGTHVAGTVGGQVYGVAKGVNLISVRVFSCRSITSESRVIMAVDWITENAERPAVVNMSLGRVGMEEPLETAIEKSIESGIHYVLAAGNSQMDACEYTPARTPGALTVGASDISSRWASFSNFGDCVDIYAPGVSITSAGIDGSTSTRVMSGTSMAAPHVTGIVALYLQNNPEASPAEVHAAVVSNSTRDMITDVPAGPTNLAFSLWDPVNFDPPAPPNLNLKVYGEKLKGSTKIYLLWDRTNDPAVRIYRNGSLFDTWTNTGEYTLQLSGKSSDTFRICEMNYENCSDDVPVDFSGETDFELNQPPVADFTYEVNDLEVKFTNTSTDPDGTIIRANLHFGDGYFVRTGDYVYRYQEPGTYTATLYVTDDHEKSSSISKTFTVGTVDSTPENIILSAYGYKVKGQWQTDLSWTPAGNNATIEVYRNGSYIKTVEDTGSYTDVTNLKGGGTLTYKVCHTNAELCSNEVAVTF